MTEIELIMQNWSSISKKLDQNWRLNFELLRKTNLDKARNKVTRLIWVTAVTLAFYTFCLFGLTKFAVANWSEPLLAASGLILAFWCLVICIGAVHELELMSRLQYDKPILELQKDLAKIRVVIVKYLRILVWLLPNSFVFIPLTFKGLFGFNILEQAPMDWVLWNIAISIAIFAPVSYFLWVKLNPKQIDEKWLRILFQGSGSQLNDAIVFLEEIEEFEAENRSN